VPTDQTSRWLESSRRSRARRLVASAIGVALASLTIAAGGAVAAQGTGGTQARTTSTKVTVKQIQHALGIKADGVMGPQTRRALKRFQRAHGLKANGVAGPDTLAALGLQGAQQNSSFASTQDAATVLAKIAQCESGGDIHAVSANGRYFGKYQFSQATWDALGGTGSPADADENVQDMYAAQLYSQRGTDPWPACAAQIS
jgi:peptidoglycan hydrolase-like protein with peptidoglycan-binding domain